MNKETKDTKKEAENSLKKTGKKAKKSFEDFKKFAFRGNVVDLAVGVIIGGAFGKIVTSLVTDIVTPLIGLIMKDDLKNLNVVLREAVGDKPEIIMNYGNFLTVILDFFIIALTVFAAVKFIENLRNKLPKEEKPKAAPTTKKCPFCLSDINIAATRCPQCTSELPPLETAENKK